MLLREAVTTQLGSVVRALSPVPPWSRDGDPLRVCLSAAELDSVPDGCRVLLRLREQDIDGLNLARPMFAEKRLRAVLWVDEATLEPLVRRGVDLVDWVSRSDEVPPRGWPEFTVDGVSAALEHGVPFVWGDERERLDALLGEQGWSEGVVELRAQMSFRQMLRQLEQPGLPVVEGIERAVDPWRVRMALARVGREGAWVARGAELELAGMWRLHARQEDWELATQRLAEAGWAHAALMAGWVDLEPERIDWAVEHPEWAPSEPQGWEPARVVVGDGPSHVLRARVGDEDVQQVRMQLREGAVPDGVARVVVWSEGSAPWVDNEDDGPVNARLVRSSRCLGERTPSLHMVEAAKSAGLLGVAAELGRIRFEHGEDDHPEGVVEWLYEHGETREALRIAELWVERARRAEERQSLAVALGWQGRTSFPLGNGATARECFEEAVELCQELAEQQLDSDLQLLLSILYNMLGDLYRAFGGGIRARELFERSLTVVEGLARAEPDHLDYQRGLLVSYDRLGGIYRSLGDGERAHGFHLKMLVIAEKLVQVRPSKMECQRDLSIACERIGSAAMGSGQFEEARECYERRLVITEEVAKVEPDRADYRRNLSVSYAKLGELAVALGQADKALGLYEEWLFLIQELAELEPARVDYQRDLSACYGNLGVLVAMLGQVENAYEFHHRALTIIRKLTREEPGRTDYQRDLSISYGRLGDFALALRGGSRTHEYYEQSLSIMEKLAKGEPDRVDYQRDLSVSYHNLAQVQRAQGNLIGALGYLEQDLGIAEHLAALDPGSVEYQDDVAISELRLSDLLTELERNDEAATRLARARRIWEQLDSAGCLPVHRRDTLEELRG